MVWLTAYGMVNIIWYG